MIRTLEEYIDWVTFPALFVWLVLTGPRLGAIPWITLTAAGFVLWTLAEYVIHRWVLHGFYWMAIHQRHHERPMELTRFPLWQIPGYFFVIWLVLHYTAGGTIAVPLFAGVVAGYVWFFTMHTLEHHAQWLVPQLAINHNAHHKVTTCNYGITVTWWDRAFGTYRAPRIKS